MSNNWMVPEDEKVKKMQRKVTFTSSYAQQAASIHLEVLQAWCGQSVLCSQRMGAVRVVRIGSVGGEDRQ